MFVLMEIVLVYVKAKTDAACTRDADQFAIPGF